MSHGYCASVQVDFVLSDIKQFHVGDADNREGFVELEVVDLADCETGAGQYFLGGLVGGDGEVNGIEFCIGVSDYSGQGP
jgi:hypothetical protein